MEITGWSDGKIFYEKSVDVSVVGGGGFVDGVLAVVDNVSVVVVAGKVGVVVFVVGGVVGCFIFNDWVSFWNGVTVDGNVVDNAVVVTHVVTRVLCPGEAAFIGNGIGVITIGNRVSFYGAFITGCRAAINAIAKEWIDEGTQLLTKFFSTCVSVFLVDINAFEFRVQHVTIP